MMVLRLATVGMSCDKSSIVVNHPPMVGNVSNVTDVAAEGTFESTDVECATV